MNKMEKQKKILSERLLEEQGRMGLSHSEMAIRLDISESQYDNMVNCRRSGSRGYSLDTLNKIFDNTEIKPNEIF